MVTVGEYLNQVWLSPGSGVQSTMLGPRDLRDRGFDPLVEIRGDWYTYFESITTLGVEATGDTIKMVNMVLLACGTGRGITGEISWTVDPNARDAAAAAGISRNSNGGNVWRTTTVYLQAFKDGDLDGVARRAWRRAAINYS